MGVAGLTPFLQKHCPNAIQALPGRLKAFKGKTIAIDGTLISQRLHWSPMPYHYRHVLGWYRIVKEFDEAGANLVCVFDGKERTEAKKAEILRRRYTRRVNVQRASIEKERLGRLKKLEQLVGPKTKDVEDRGKDTRTSVTTTLRLALTHDKGVPQAPQKRERESQQIKYPEDDHITELMKSVFKGTTASHETPVSKDQVVADSRHVRTVANSLTFDVLTLYQEYEKSLHSKANRVTEVTTCEDEVVDASPIPDSDDDEHSKEIVASKLQKNMAAEEGVVWSELASPSNDVDPRESLSKLVTRSEYILNTYEKRGVAPSATMYEECRMFLEAMGIPCLVSTGPFEGEALASSLVMNGHADVVASEDMDVLLYGAPLVRHLTSGRSSLQLIDPTSIHHALSFTLPQFVDFALLLGTDFTQRLPNIGPERAFKYLQLHSDIESILKNLDLKGKDKRFMPRGAGGVKKYLEEIKKARKVFGRMPPGTMTLRRKEKDEDRVAELLDHFQLRQVIEEEERTEREMVGHWGDGAALAGNYFGDDPGGLITEDVDLSIVEGKN